MWLYVYVFVYMWPYYPKAWLRPVAPFLDTVEPCRAKMQKCVLPHLHSVTAESNRQWNTLSTCVRSQNWTAACWAFTKQKRMPSAGWRWRWRRHSWNEMNVSQHKVSEWTQQEASGTIWSLSSSSNTDSCLVRCSSCSSCDWYAIGLYSAWAISDNTQ